MSIVVSLKSVELGSIKHNFHFYPKMDEIKINDHNDINNIICVIVNNFFIEIRKNPNVTYLSMLISDIDYIKSANFSIDIVIRYFVENTLIENNFDEITQKEYLKLCTSFYSYILKYTIYSEGTTDIFSYIDKMLLDIKIRTTKHIMNNDGNSEEYTGDVILIHFKNKLYEFVQSGITYDTVDVFNRNIHLYFLCKYIESFNLYEFNIQSDKIFDLIEQFKRNINIIFYRCIDFISVDYFQTIYSGTPFNKQYDTNIILLFIVKIVELVVISQKVKDSNPLKLKIVNHIITIYCDMLYHIDLKVKKSCQNIFLTNSYVKNCLIPLISILRPEYIEVLKFYYFTRYDRDEYNDIMNVLSNNCTNNYNIDLDILHN